jgi:hypothetical protein
MKEYFLQIGESIQKGIAGVGEKSQEEVSKSQEFGDVPGYTEEKQTVVDENEINEAFEPANDAFSALNELGDWIVDFFTNLLSGVFGTIM